MVNTILNLGFAVCLIFQGIPRCSCAFHPANSLVSSRGHNCQPATGRSPACRHGREATACRVDAVQRPTPVECPHSGCAICAATAQKYVPPHSEKRPPKNQVLIKLFDRPCFLETEKTGTYLWSPILNDLATSCDILALQSLRE